MRDKSRLKNKTNVSCSTHQVFVAEGEPAVFECRVEPKHDLNLAVRWYRNDEELVGAGSCSWHIPQNTIQSCHHDFLSPLFVTYPFLASLSPGCTPMSPFVISVFTLENFPFLSKCFFVTFYHPLLVTCHPSPPLVARCPGGDCASATSELAVTGWCLWWCVCCALHFTS